MKHAAGIVVAVALCALPAHGEQVELSATELHALTPIGSVPTKTDIEKIFPQNTVAELTAIAGATNLDFGVRLRAIRALPQFCLPACGTSPIHASLVTLLQSVSENDSDGKSLLLIRATIEALGAAKSNLSDDVNLLTPFLDSTNRDIRAAAAFALRDLCQQSAVTRLRNRYNIEAVPQVRLAISAALRDLSTCSN